MEFDFLLVTLFFSLFFLHFHHSSCYWISLDNGKLIYTQTSAGDRILDFSPVGYKADDHVPEDVPVLVNLSPAENGSDNGYSLQQAISKVSSSPLNASTGFRGAIHLSDGNFFIGDSRFVLNASGVVIKGSTNTTLVSNSSSHEPLFSVASPQETISEVGARVAIVKTVPSGSSHIKVKSSFGFQQGDLVRIVWPKTSKWLKLMKMEHANISTTYIERYIHNIEGDNLVLDVQVPFRMDQELFDVFNFAYVVKVNVGGRVNNIGLQNFRAVHEAGGFHPATGGFLSFGSSVEDSWVKDVSVDNFGLNTVTVAGKRVTVGNVRLTGHYRGRVVVEFPGSQVLVKNSLIDMNSWNSYSTRNGANGPNVFYNCTSGGSLQPEVQSHFATGVLYDNIQVTRGTMAIGSRFSGTNGYAGGYNVAWNGETTVLRVVNPPQVENWAIGVKSQAIDYMLGDEKLGNIDSGGIESDELASLYLVQKRIAGGKY